MNDKYKTFEELKEEFGEDYEHKFYEMGLSAVKENERLIEELQRKDNNWNELKEYIQTSDECWDLQAVLDKINELEERK